MPRTSVALISAAPPAALGSMAAVATLVSDALEKHAPYYDLVLVTLRDSATAGRGWSGRLAQIRQIFEARTRSRQARADVYHILDGSFAYLVDGIPWERTLVTVHDLIPALQSRGRWPAPVPGWAAQRAIGMTLDRIRKAGAVHAVSCNTALDLREIAGRTADEVLYFPLRPLPYHTGNETAHRSLSTPFVLHVGSNAFYKNRLGVVAAFAKLARQREDVRLVLAGAAPTGRLRELIAEHGLESRVDFLIDVDDDQLASLYRRAAVLLFPSIYEGMGWPPLEAMRYGCPVVCSNVSSLPEAVGDAALLCDPHDVDGLATAVARVLSSPGLASDLSERGYRNVRRFGTEDFALGLHRLYEKLSASRT